MNQQIKTSNHELGIDEQNWVIQNFGKLVRQIQPVDNLSIIETDLDPSLHPSAFVKYTL